VVSPFYLPGQETRFLARPPRSAGTAANNNRHLRRHLWQSGESRGGRHVHCNTPSSLNGHPNPSRKRSSSCFAPRRSAVTPTRQASGGGSDRRCAGAWGAGRPDAVRTA